MRVLRQRKRARLNTQFEDYRTRNVAARNPGDVTLLLSRWACGDAKAEAELLAVVYDELRQLAGALLRGERPGHTLQATEVVHEAFLKLMASATPSFEDRRHFFGIAARAMRQLLVDHARGHAREKRLDPALRRPLELAASTPAPAAGEEVLAVHAALEGLARDHPRYARVVELRYFGGFSLEECAEVLGISRATAARDWALARALLQDQLVTDG